MKLFGILFVKELLTPKSSFTDFILFDLKKSKNYCLTIKTNYHEQKTKHRN